MKITSEITTNMTTVIASVSNRATATRPARTDMSSHTAPGSRMFTLKSSGNLLILYIIIFVQVLANSMSIRLMASSFFLLMILAYIWVVFTSEWPSSLHTV